MRMKKGADDWEQRSRLNGRQGPFNASHSKPCQGVPEF